MSEPQQPDPQRGPETYSQGVQHTPVAARLPEDVVRGVFCNATMILQSHEEFVIDFLETMVQPQQVVSRVVLSPMTFGQLLAALRENLSLYENNFGRLKSRDARPPVTAPMPAPPSAPADAAAEARPSPQEPGGSPQGPPQEMPQSRDARPTPPRVEDLYDQLKLPDRLLGGVFANVVMIRHLAEEFCFDFVANFYPRSVVTARVFMAAGRIPSFLDAMSNALSMFRQRFQGPPPQQPPIIV